MSCSRRILLAVTSPVTESSFIRLLQMALGYEINVKMLMNGFLTGSLRDASECASYGSSDGLSSHQGNNKLPIRPAQTPLGVLECRPHLLVTRSGSGSYDRREQRQQESLLHRSLSSQSEAISSDTFTQRTGCPECPLLMDRTDNLSLPLCSGPLGESSFSHSVLSIFNHPADFHALQLPQQSPALQTVETTDASRAAKEKGTDKSNYQRENWCVWQVLSSENPDTLPESLV